MPSGQVPIVLGTYIHLMHIVPGGAVAKLERAELLPVVLGGTVPRLERAERLPSVLIRPLRELEREHLLPIVLVRPDVLNRCHIVLLLLLLLIIIINIIPATPAASIHRGRWLRGNNSRRRARDGDNGSGDCM